MDMQDAFWDLEERVEDAFVEYIRAQSTMAAMVVASREIVTARYPLVVVAVEGSDNRGEMQAITGRKNITVSIGIVTEAVNRAGESGSIEASMTARELHRAVKRSVLRILWKNTLHLDLNAVGIKGVKFSFAFPGSQERDQGDGKIVTIQNMDVNAQPAEV